MTVFFYILINQEMIKLPKDSTVLLHTKFGFTQQPYSSPNFAPTSCISLDNLYGIFSQSILEFEGNGTPLQYFCLENPMDGGAWQAAVHGVAKSQMRLTDFTFTLHFHALQKEMATHSSVLAWRIPGMGEPGGCRLWGLTESDTTEATQQQALPTVKIQI